MIDDTSEIPHDVGCKVESVNLLTYPNSTANMTDAYGMDIQGAWTKGQMTLTGVFSPGPPQARVFYPNLTQSNGTNYETYAMILENYSIKIPRGTYTFSANDTMENVPTSPGVCRGSLVVGKLKGRPIDGTAVIYRTGDTFTVDVEDMYGVFIVYMHTGNVSETFENISYTAKPMLNRGDTALPYTPYVDVSGVTVTRYGESAADNLETYTANADGTVDGIKSLCPVMTLATDVSGVKLTVDYHKSWGKQAEYDAFWDAFQENGNRTHYIYAFSYRSWKAENLKPKYVIRPREANNMFQQMGYVGEQYTVDLRPIKDKLDFSQATNMNYCFQTSKITHLGVVDVRSCGSNLNNTFGNMYDLKEIEKIIVCETNTFPSTFAQCWANKITFEGVVASDLNLAQVRCDKANFKNIIGVLSGATSGKTLTLHKGAVTTAFGSTDSDEWKNLIATKSNWTIALA